MKKITLLCAFLITSLGFSQTYDLLTNGDFENGTEPWVGNNLSVVAGEAFVSETNAGGNPWDTQLVHANLQFEENKEYVFTFYARAAADRKITVAIQNVGAWSDQFRADYDLTTTMTMYTATFNASSSFSNVQIGFLMSGAGFTDGIYYDNISLMTAGAASETCTDGIMNNGETAIDCGGPNCDACPEPPTTAAPTPPARNAADVMSIYSEAYASVGLINVPWDDGDTSPTTVAGNELLMMEVGNFLGQTLGTPVDASNMTHFHMDYYVADEFADGQVFNSKLSNHEKASGEDGESNALEFNLALTASDVKTWKSIDVALGDAKRGNIKEFLITVSNTVKLAYLDNIYLYRESTASVDNNALLGFSMYPNPASNRLNISAKEAIQNAAVYNVLGKKVMSLEINKSSESIDISNLASGIYLIKYNVNNKVGTAKFVKQ
ncbi:T9SS type A sorting domain-containing protein [Polaribacter sp.]|uniref:T9SS type A sorting domain-containing protein n=1 Tax=Polaribacter sp. TaxID=1920175 RepID=UPI0026122929|nr:T9SS type A sorting domain-containing protein [Polaribacter sp.]MBT3742218.1 T9SS type A sorting domain-containing protein [Polaribacter sp.]MDG1403475.1 carbohydrate binding domain-containing protein [Polaribacter sp.]